MDKAKSIAKSGWHPSGKDGGKESWRGDFKGINQVAGWVGKGKSTSHTQQATEHSSRPLASLKNPADFGPPPKNANYHGGTAPSPASPADGRGLSSPVSSAPPRERRGLGAPLSTQEIQANQAQEQEEQNKPAPPPVPYRANRTGIDTRNLPKPPQRSINNDDSTDSPNQSLSSVKPKPSLPPRLPPRQNSQPGENSPDPPPPYSEAAEQSQAPAQEAHLNQNALQRLGRAGVSVPALGIGQQVQPASPASPSQATSPINTTSSSTDPDTATSLASRLNKVSIASSPSTNMPAQGTSLQQKQDAVRTAQQFRKDPSSVSLADARNTAHIANSFRERHGEQVAAGSKWAHGLNNKYGIANKVGAYTGGQSATPGAQSPPAQHSSGSSQWTGEQGQGVVSSPPTAGAFKKPPPPPPAARGTGVGSPPPPVPVGSKPRT